MQNSFQYNNANISYHVFGEADPIVLLHGFGEDSSIFRNQISFLQDNYKVIVPDLPGSGSSELIRKLDSVTIDDYADIILQLLKIENVTSCIMLGHSMGGYITLSFTERHSEYLKAFGLIHSSAAADTNEKKDSRKQGINMINEYGAFAFLKNTIPNLFAEEFKKNNTDEVNDLISNSKQFSAEALIEYYNAMMHRPDRLHVLEKALVPVLFVIGKEDNAAPLNIVIDQVHIPKTSFIHILDNVGHMSMLEAPDKLNDVLHQFLTAVNS